MNKCCAVTPFIDSLYKQYGELPINIVIVSLTVCLAVLLSYLLKTVLQKRMSGTSMSGLSLLVNLVRIAIAIGVVFLLGENIFHIQMSGLAQALGLTTLAVSLGLQDLIKSIVAGVLIVAGDIVSVGDQVIMGDHRGEVMDINWHQITIRDRDGIPHLIPNSEIMSDSFMRATGKMAARHMFECQITPGVNL